MGAIRMVNQRRGSVARIGRAREFRGRCEFQAQTVRLLSAEASVVRVEGRHVCGCATRFTRPQAVCLGGGRARVTGLFVTGVADGRVSLWGAFWSWIKHRAGGLKGKAIDRLEIH